MKLSEEVLTIVHAFSDKGRKDGIRKLAGRVEKLEEFIERFSEEPCAYGDGCPHNAGTRHGDCTPCLARRALEP